MNEFWQKFKHRNEEVAAAYAALSDFLQAQQAILPTIGTSVGSADYPFPYVSRLPNSLCYCMGFDVNSQIDRAGSKSETPSSRDLPLAEHQAEALAPILSLVC